MKRFAVPFVIAGSVVVLIALFVLLRSITSGTTPTPPPTTKAPESPTATAAPELPSVPGRSPAPSGGSSLAHMLRPHKRAADSEGTTGTAPSATDERPEERGDGPPATRFNTKNLQFGMTQIREQIAGNAPQIAACIGSNKPTGKATLTFIVAHRGDKYVIEQSDYDREGSTVQDEALLDCFAKAANAMQFQGLPREADAIIVTRSIGIDSGAVTEDKATFSYIR